MDSIVKLKSILILHYSLTKSGPQNSENGPQDGKFKTVVMTKDNRRYYLDLKENDRGRFLRVRYS